MLKTFLLAIAEDLFTFLSDLPWKRWGIVGSVWLLLTSAVIRRGGWFGMIDVWQVPWQSMPYVRVNWTLFPTPWDVLCTVIGLLSVGYLMVMANRMARDI